jgi:hypothetical protein
VHHSIQSSFKFLLNNVKFNFICLNFFSDGVRLQPEDEKFIQEKVLENHPEKQSKVSGAIDYIMVWFLMLLLGSAFTMLSSI